MLFNLDASNRPVIALEGRTCCYLHRVQTRAAVLSRSTLLSITQFLSFSKSQLFLLKWPSTALCIHSLLFPFPTLTPCFFHVVLSSCFFFLPASLSEPHTPVRDGFLCVCVCVCLRMSWVRWGFSPLSCEAQPNTAVSGFRSSVLHATYFAFI